MSRAAPAPADQSSRLKRAQLVAWSAAALGVALLRPLNFSTQFLVGAGFPLLALAALGLSRFRPAVTLWVALPFCSTLLVALGFVLEPRPQWLVPTERLRVVDSLRAECRKGDRVFAPEDIGLFAFGTTPCGAFVSHPIAPSYASRRAELASFSRGSREHRARLLDDSAITLLVLPHDDGPVPASWLPDATPFRRVSTIEGGSSRWSLYRRKAVTDPRPF